MSHTVVGLASEVRVRVPIATPNFANSSHGHWTTVATKRKRQRRAVLLHLLAARVEAPPMPVVVTIDRVSFGTLDAHDGLPNAAKSVVDATAEWLGLPSDSHPMVRWRYQQTRGKRGEHAVVITIATDTEQGDRECSNS